jgi:C-terminal processing protease CtpA/Prc
MRKEEYGPSARRLVLSAALLGLTGCGGGGGGDGGGGGTGSGNPGVQYTPGVFISSSSFAAQCAAPRAGIDPTTGRPYPDVHGSVTAENHWLRSWTNELYLWYREVPDVDPASFPTTAAYFELQKTAATTASGKPKDRFHFTFPTEQWRQLAQSGVQAGYGVEWVIVSGQPPRRVVVAYTQPNSPATSANLARGAEILAVDSIDLVNTRSQAGVDTLNAGLFPDTAGEVHSFMVLDPDGTTRSITMQSANVTSAPVQNVQVLSTSTGPVGYMLFNDHMASAESPLIGAVNTLRTANVTDLVLDIRYNGGGFLDIAAELAYMIAGSGPTAGRAFETLRFNDKHTATDPVTGEPLIPTPFHTTTQFSTPAGQPLPTLNLPRVFVLTGPNTCSASESIINGLRGVNVEVIQIGSTTCGKPYGFHPADNCGTTYFSIQFQGDNAQGFGDYPDGFSPANGGAGFRIPGCSVADDFSRALGDPQERRLAAALQYRSNQSCPAASGFAPGMLGITSMDQADGVMRRNPWRENRILRSMQ